MSSDLTSIYSQGNLNAINFNKDGVYDFDRFRLDAAHRMLYENIQPVSLAPKVIETLIALIERRGQIVSKDELMSAVWADSFVEESNLTQNIYLLRKTLGKSADGQDLIETFRRRGYRFTGQIKEVQAERAENVPEDKLKSREEQISTNSPATTVAAAVKIEKSRGGAFDSLAVLPLTNESADLSAEYLSDGITESIINRLSQISKLRVLARSTVFQYKNRDAAPQQIGRELSVSAVLTGRVLQYGERLIIRAELVATTDGCQIWGEQYDRAASDILELQETIAREISENLHLKLSGEEQKRLTKRYTESSEAYQLFIKGRYFLNKRLTKAIEQAAALFQRAIDLDPTFAPAYVGLADSYPLLSLYGALTPQEAYPKAKAAALKALEIDDRFTKAYNSLGVVKLFYEWDWRGAEQAFRQAIELSPGYPDAHQRYGMFLTAVGRFDEAEAELRKARQLDPLSLITKTIGGYPLYYSQRYDEAARHFQEVMAIDAEYSMAHFRLGLTFAQQGKYEAAIAELQTSIGLSNDRDTIAAHGYVQGLAGNSEKALAALNELDERERAGFVTSYNRALIEIGLNDKDAALNWLERAYAERSYWLIYLKVDPALNPLRANPRFINLQEKVFGANAIDERESVKAISANDLYAGTKPKTRAEKNVMLVAGQGKQKRYLLIAAIASAMLLLAVFAAPHWFDSKTQNPQNQSAAPNVKITRLTPDINVYNASFTPDGNHLIYTLREKGKNSGWLKDLATGNATLVLPPVNENYYGVTVSGDGFLYYSTERKNAPNYTIIRVPMAGGGEQVIASDTTSPFALSPDEKQLAFMNGKTQLTIAAADGSGEPRVLAGRDRKTGWYESWGSKMSWSPDGASIAVCSGRYENGKPFRELIEVNAVDGAEKIIPTPNWNYLDDVVWLADKSGLIVAARETEAAPFQIWRVAYPNGEARRITSDTNDYTDPSVSPDSRRLIVTQNLGNLNLWLAPFEDISKAKQITFGNAAQDGFWGTAFTPDKQIIYTSPRGGNLDLWETDAGGEQKQLTKNAGDWNGRPRTTPDGRYIIFASTRSGTRQIWRMDADGGNPKQLTDAAWADEPTLSPDGEWIYYTERGEKTVIARIPVDGGQAARVSQAAHDVFSPVVSPDGKLIFCQFYDEASTAPWKNGIMNVGTGEIVKNFDFHIGGMARWAADSKSIIYVLPEQSKLWLLSLGGGSKPQELVNFESGTIRTFALSQDFKQIVFARGNPTNEAVSLENF